MANLNSVAELAWRQLFPNPGDEAALTKEEFQETAKLEYAYQLLLFYYKERREFGLFIFPSYMLNEIELPVVDNEVDIKELTIFRSLPSDLWLQNVGGVACKCTYVKTDVNMAQLMCDDDSLDSDYLTYYVVNNKIKFPDGVHQNPITIIYANRGDKLNGFVEVDDALAGIVRTRLVEIYGGKIGKEDDTNNSNSNN